MFLGELQARQNIPMVHVISSGDDSQLIYFIGSFRSSGLLLWQLNRLKLVLLVNLHFAVLS